MCQSNKRVELLKILVDVTIHPQPFPAPKRRRLQQAHFIVHLTDKSALTISIHSLRLVYRLHSVIVDQALCKMWKSAPPPPPPPSSSLSASFLFNPPPPRPPLPPKPFYLFSSLLFFFLLDSDFRIFFLSSVLDRCLDVLHWVWAIMSRCAVWHVTGFCDPVLPRSVAFLIWFWKVKISCRFLEIGTM